MAKKFFITGTDTDAGKTVASCALLHALNQDAVRAVGFKPIASGATLTAEGWRNSDGLALQAASFGKPAYELINPICFEPAIAPHIAAAQVGECITGKRLSEHLHELEQQSQAEVILVEGVGGWMVPLNQQELVCDWVIQEQMAVILVVGAKLGCINHALLTVAAIQRAGLTLAGWVINQGTEPMPYYLDNEATLRAQIAAPLLGIIPPLSEPFAPQNGHHLNIGPLI